SAESNDPRVKKFVADYRKKYSDQTPAALAAIAYDAGKIVLAAIEKAGVSEANEANRAKLRDALAATKEFPGVTGNTTIDECRNAFKPAVTLQVQGKKFHYVSTVQP